MVLGLEVGLHVLLAVERDAQTEREELPAVELLG